MNSAILKPTVWLKLLGLGKDTRIHLHVVNGQTNRRLRAQKISFTCDDRVASAGAAWRSGYLFWDRPLAILQLGRSNQGQPRSYQCHDSQGLFDYSILREAQH